MYADTTYFMSKQGMCLLAGLPDPSHLAHVPRPSLQWQILRKVQDGDKPVVIHCPRLGFAND